MSKRSETRYAAVKALYAYDIETNIDDKKLPGELALDIITYYHNNEEGVGGAKIDEKFLLQLVKGVCENVAVIDDVVKKNLSNDWNISRLGPVIRAILRSAVYELLNFADTPLKVIINEYVEITKSFFDEKDVSFVNGILDKIGHAARE